MEVEINKSLPFLDILITRNDDGLISHQVYRKKTHTEQYLHASSHHHPTHKLGVLNVLAIRALRIFDKEHLEEEIEQLTKVFLKEGYKKHQAIRAIEKAYTGPNKNKNFDNIKGKVNLPYILGTTDKISSILKNNGILTTFKPLNTIRNCLKPVNDKIDPKCHKGVYLIPCSCGKPYVGETGRSFSTRIQEHSANIKHNRSKS